MLVDAGRPDLACEVTDHHAVLRAWLPGISLDRVRVALHGDRLTIWGTTHDDESAPIDQNGHLCHSVRLPNPVNLARTRVEFHQGELTVTLPRAHGRMRMPHEVSEKAVIPPSPLRELAAVR